MAKNLIGIILKPRGLKGELKVQIQTNILRVFDSLKSVYLDKTKFKVKSSSIQNGFAYLKLDTVTSIELAENLRGAKVLVNNSQIKLDDDELLEGDLVGFDVQNESEKSIGTVTGIEVIGSRVIIEMGRDVSFPYEDDFVVETKIADRVLIVRENMLITEEIR